MKPNEYIDEEELFKKAIMSLTEKLSQLEQADFFI